MTARGRRPVRARGGGKGDDAVRLSSAARVRRFVRAYVAGGKGVVARAGPAAYAAGLGQTRGAAAVRGHKLLRDPAVRAAIERELEAVGATTGRIVQELGRIAFADVRDVEAVVARLERGEPLDDVPDRVAAAVGTVSRVTSATDRGVTTSARAEPWNKLEALRVLAKIRGALVERAEVTGPGGGPVQHAHAVFYLPVPARVRDPALVVVTAGTPAPNGGPAGPAGAGP